MTDLPVSPELLETALPSPPRSATRIGHGGNSRVFRVECSDGNEYAAKFYFRRADIGRSRLEVEFAAVSFMWEHGIRCIPRPICANTEHDFAVFEFVAGTEIDTVLAGSRELDQLLGFATDLKTLSRSPEGCEFPLAADAAVSINALFRQIETRLQRLRSHAPETSLDQVAMRFITDDFVPAVTELQSRFARNTSEFELSDATQTLSPSDFGFHNALRRPSGELTFLDFEFFGRDDPAKMIADFLLHPAQSLAEGFKQAFAKKILKTFGADNQLAARLEYVYPIVGLKWCMIMLNEFVPSDFARRTFAARDSLALSQKKSTQLAKSKAMLAKIMNENWRFPYTGFAA